ncbi:TPA: hypothetical protein WLH41_001747, partial [Neisseria gonorrhoeae]
MIQNPFRCRLNASDGILFAKELQGAGNFDDVEAFQLVAFHDFVVAFEH